jgi:threonine dehydrogenase-like Zn-dependent dehydrogenase
MSVKIDPKVIAGIAAAISTVAVAGVVSYNKNSKFKTWVDTELYPEFKKIVKENSAFAVRTGIEVALVNYPKAKIVFLNIVNAVESGKMKLPKYITKELLEIKNDLPKVINVLNQNAVSLNAPQAQIE